MGYQETTCRVALGAEAVEAFCRKWRITKLELFGSALRDDFSSESDVDFLVTFDEDARWTLFDVIHAQEELARIVGRSVDLVSRRPIERSENWIRRRSILDSARTVYVA